VPSKNMLRKGKRRQSVKADYRVSRDATEAAEAAELAATEARIYGEAEEAERLAAAAKAAIPNTAVPDRPKRAGKGGFQKSGKRQQRALVDEAPALKPSVMDEDDELILPEAAPLEMLAATMRRAWIAGEDAHGKRLDLYLSKALPEISRARAQLLIDHNQVRVNDVPGKAKYKMHGGESIVVEGEPTPTPLRATAEDIPLTIVYEDKHLAVIDKPAGMMVHAGSGLTEDARSSGTLVNALLFHFKDKLSDVGGALRPGIVHRLDKQTSGLIMVAKSDASHRALAEMFSERTLEKHYITLVHRHVKADRGTIDLPIARDRVRRTRMTTRVPNQYMTTASHGAPSLRHPDEPEVKARRPNDPRPARSLYTVLERLHTTAGDFTLLDVKIETGRTHQIRVHMQSLGHPVVGDTLYGAPAKIPGIETASGGPTLPRNFLHAARLQLNHPITQKPLELEADLPTELTELLDRLRALEITAAPAKRNLHEDW
jgi:23S rRNA pseudouridine1911/1915/1917 synthase